MEFLASKSDKQILSGILSWYSREDNGDRLVKN